MLFLFFPRNLASQPGHVCTPSHKCRVPNLIFSLLFTLFLFLGIFSSLLLSPSCFSFSKTLLYLLWENPLELCQSHIIPISYYTDLIPFVVNVTAFALEGLHCLFLFPICCSQLPSDTGDILSAESVPSSSFNSLEAPDTGLCKQLAHDKCLLID